MSSNAIQIPVMIKEQPKSFGLAWVALCVAFAVHVTDEALTDFLSVYNPVVQALRRHFPFLPLPTFTFDVWLTGLIVAVVLLLSLSPFAFRASRMIVPLAYVFGIIMLANSLGHLTSSLYMRRAMPGVYSSPLLLVCSVYLLSAVRRRGESEP